MPELAKYQDGKLTRAGMEDEIQHGRGVLHNGRVITKVEHLPSEAELAQGNPDRVKAARTAIDEQLARLLAQRDLLEQDGKDSATKPGPHEALVAAPGEETLPPDMVGSQPPTSGPDAPDTGKTRKLKGSDSTDDVQN